MLSNNSHRSLLMAEVMEEREPILGGEKLEEEEAYPIFSFLFFGFVGNLCFNFLLQEIAFFNAVFSDSFGSLCGMCFGGANNIGQLLIIWKGSNWSFTTRINAACIVLGGTMMAIPLLSLGAVPFRLYAALMIVIMMGLACAVLSSTGFGLVGLCPPKVRTYYTVGTSLAGVMAWPMMIVFDNIFKRVFGLSPKRAEGAAASPVDVATTLTLMGFAAMCFYIVVPFYTCWLSRTPTVVQALAKSQVRKESSATSKRNMWQIFADTAPLALAVWNIQFVSFLVFPDQVVLWKSDKPGRYGGEFGYKNINIYVFQFFDVVSRIMVVSGVELSSKKIKVGSAMRLLLVPFFFLAVYRISIFDLDLFKFGLVALFAVSYGLVLTWGMIRGSSQVKPHEAHVAGYIMSFSVVNGILCGAVTSLAIKFVLPRIIGSLNLNQECSIDPDTFGMVCVEPTT